MLSASMLVTGNHWNPGVMLCSSGSAGTVAKHWPPTSSSSLKRTVGTRQDNRQAVNHGCLKNGQPHAKVVNNVLVYRRQPALPKPCPTVDARQRLLDAARLSIRCVSACFRDASRAINACRAGVVSCVTPVHDPVTATLVSSTDCPATATRSSYCSDIVVSMRQMEGAITSLTSFCSTSIMGQECSFACCSSPNHHDLLSMFSIHYRSPLP